MLKVVKEAKVEFDPNSAPPGYRHQQASRAL